MAQKILIKKSTVAGKVPTPAQLDVGELAVNTADAILYTKDSDGLIKLLGIGAGWLSKLVERTGLSSGYFASKAINFRQNSQGAEQAAGLKVDATIAGETTGDGWLAGADINVSAQANAITPKIYGAGLYAQFDAGSNTSGYYGVETVVNYIHPTATVDKYVGYLFPDISQVPNIDNINSIYSFASLMPKAPILNSGPYKRMNSRGQVQEMSPSPIGSLTNQIHWCIGRFGDAPQVQELPAGVLCVGAIHLPETTTLGQLGVYISVAVPSNGKLALYSQAPSGYLGTKLWESGDIPISAQGNAVSTLSLELESGTYLATFNATATLGIRTVANAYAYNIFGTVDAETTECIPFYSIGSYPTSLPAELGSTPPTGYLAPNSPDFNFKVLK